MGAFGGSYLNHQYLICACAPVFKDAPPVDARGAGCKRQAEEDAGLALGEGRCGARPIPAASAARSRRTATPSTRRNRRISRAAFRRLRVVDGVGRPEGTERLGLPLPPQTTKTIGDTLSAKAISWAWYAGGWNDALAGRHAGRPAKSAAVIYTRAERRAEFPAASSAVQLLLRGLRPARRTATSI